ncbi:sporulation protein [Bacillus litorisediminis]|uniref:sporulation protein n=1 Tax=Bacillus litorisediminis TaxID=2922713 RepID=UPI001FAD7FCA|nr:sporulation protein [Bacillus litorisediminis]
MYRTLFLGMLSLTIVSITGCAFEAPKEPDEQWSLVRTIDPAPQSIDYHSRSMAEKIEHDIEKLEDIYDVMVIKGKDETLVAYKVKHLERFHMKTIEKDLEKMLEDRYPDENFTLSSDYKIFLEAVKLKNKMKDPSFTEEQAEKEFQELLSLQKELT